MQPAPELSQFLNLGLTSSLAPTQRKLSFFLSLTHRPITDCRTQLVEPVTKGSVEQHRCANWARWPYPGPSRYTLIRQSERPRCEASSSCLESTRPAAILFTAWLSGYQSSRNISEPICRKMRHRNPRISRAQSLSINTARVNGDGTTTRCSWSKEAVLRACTLPPIPPPVQVRHYTLFLSITHVTRRLLFFSFSSRLGHFFTLCIVLERTMFLRVEGPLVEVASVRQETLDCDPVQCILSTGLLQIEFLGFRET